MIKHKLTIITPEKFPTLTENGFTFIDKNTKHYKSQILYYNSNVDSDLKLINLVNYKMLVLFDDLKPTKLFLLDEDHMLHIFDETSDESFSPLKEIISFFKDKFNIIVKSYNKDELELPCVMMSYIFSINNQIIMDHFYVSKIYDGKTYIH